MANGSSHEGPARADRLREKYAKHSRLTQRAIDELPPYRAEMDSEITVNTKGLQAKGVPGWMLGAAIIILAFAAAVVIVMRWR